MKVLFCDSRIVFRAPTYYFSGLRANSEALLKKNHQKILKIPDFRKFRPKKKSRNLRFFEKSRFFRKSRKFSKFFNGNPMWNFEIFENFRKFSRFSKNLKFRGFFFRSKFSKIWNFQYFLVIFFKKCFRICPQTIKT